MLLLGRLTRRMRETTIRNGNLRWSFGRDDRVDELLPKLLGLRGLLETVSWKRLHELLPGRLHVLMWLHRDDHLNALRVPGILHSLHPSLHERQALGVNFFRAGEEVAPDASGGGEVGQGTAKGFDHHPPVVLDLL